jgi:hypothetical protein
LICCFLLPIKVAIVHCFCKPMRWHCIPHIGVSVACIQLVGQSPVLDTGEISAPSSSLHVESIQCLTCTATNRKPRPDLSLCNLIWNL